MKNIKMNISEKTMKQIEENIKKDGIQKIVVGAVIIFNSNSPLVVKRVSDDFLGGLVELPSGTVDKGEKIMKALVREVKEETGLDIASINSFVGAFDYISGSGKKTRQINFKAATTNDKIVLSEEHDAFYILPISSKEFKKLNISDSTRGIIKNAFKQVTSLL